MNKRKLLKGLGAVLVAAVASPLAVAADGGTMLDLLRSSARSGRLQRNLEAQALAYDQIAQEARRAAVFYEDALHQMYGVPKGRIAAG